MALDTLYRDGFVAVSLTVLLTVFTGVFWWIRWFVSSRFFPSRPAPNFSGVPSTELTTRTVQTKPRWTAGEAFFMFGLTLILSSLLASIAVRSNSGTVKPDAVELRPSTVSLRLAQQPAELKDLPPQTSAILESPSPETESATENGKVEENAPENGEVEESAPAQVDSESESDVKSKIANLPLRVQVTIHFIATALALSLTLIFVRIRRGATLAHMGMVPSLEDLRQGFRATPWILAPVLAVNVVVSQLVQYEHAVTDMLALNNNLGTFLFLFASAAIVTPIAEEFQFRLLLQGGLQRIADGADLDDSSTWTPRAAWPILVTSVVFASLHLGQGAAPIPLFFLSIGLGYLYQSTGRLTPAILVHMLLNGATLCLEFCRMNAGIAAPGA